jgi:hypothetical protein
MTKDFKNWILGFAFGLPVFLLLFIAALYFGNCGFGEACGYSSLPAIIHTPIPTLIPAGMPLPEAASGASASLKCTATARGLLSAWVDAGYPESDPFQFTDLNGAACQGAFADLKPLFNEGNLWYSGALGCTSCHNTTLSAASAQMDLSSYAGILAGSRRASPEANGNDILGGGSWDAAKLNEQLFILEKMPFGRPPGAVEPDGPTILAGTPVAAP